MHFTLSLIPLLNWLTVVVLASVLGTYLGKLRAEVAISRDAGLQSLARAAQVKDTERELRDLRLELTALRLELSILREELRVVRSK